MKFPNWRSIRSTIDGEIDLIFDLSWDFYDSFLPSFLPSQMNAFKVAAVSFPAPEGSEQIHTYIHLSLPITPLLFEVTEASESINQSIHQSINTPINQYTNQSIHQSINHQCKTEIIEQFLCEPINTRVDQNQRRKLVSHTERPRAVFGTAQFRTRCDNTKTP